MPGDPDDSTETARPGAGLPDPGSIPGFRIVRRLGEGGMGVVYEAEQQHPHRPVALKVVRGGLHADPRTFLMFEREIQTLARLKHPGIAAIYDSGTTREGLPFYAMELVRGHPLGEYLRRQTSQGGANTHDLRHRMVLFKKICDAVAYAHQRGVIHRDLKPSNLFVMREPPAGTSSEDAVPDVKVIDFGLARLVDAGAQGTMLTDVGRVKGTLPYMSPEQVRGNTDEIDTRTDVYSLGVILYEMLTGALPYDVSRAALPEAVRTICEEPPRPITRTWSGSRRLDADVTTIMGRALEKEPARRYPSAQALAEDVQRFLTDQPILARPPSAAYQFRKLVARHKAPFAFAGVLFVVLAVSTAGLAVLAARNARERDRANQAAQTANRVSEFLVSLFQVSDPSESRGNAITAREILDAGAERIDRELKDQPLIRARLLDTMGNVYRSLGLYEKAEPLLLEGLRARETVLGPDHPDVALSHNSMAVHCLEQGRTREGQQEAERAVAILQAAGQGDSLPAAWGLYYLGVNRLLLGEMSAAREDLEKARSLFERLLGRSSFPVAWCLNDLGRVHLFSGELREALVPMEESLRIQEHLHGPRHPQVATALNNLGYVSMLVGDFAKARPLLERGVATAEATYGPDHPKTANQIQSLGELLRRAGDLEGAKRFLEHALKIQEAKLSPENYELALTRVSLAGISLAAGDLDRAGALYEQAVPVVDLSGVTNDEAAIALEGYAEYLRRRGRRDEAGRYLDRARQIRGKSGPSAER